MEYGSCYVHSGGNINPFAVWSFKSVAKNLFLFTYNLKAQHCQDLSSIFERRAKCTSSLSSQHDEWSVVANSQSNALNVLQFTHCWHSWYLSSAASRKEHTQSIMTEVLSVSTLWLAMSYALIAIVLLYYLLNMPDDCIHPIILMLITQPFVDGKFIDQLSAYTFVLFLLWVRRKHNFEIFKS